MGVKGFRFGMVNLMMLSYFNSSLYLEMIFQLVLQMVGSYSLKSISSFILVAALLGLEAETVLLGDVDDLRIRIHFDCLCALLLLDSAFNILFFLGGSVATLKDGEAATTAAVTRRASCFTDGFLLATVAQRAL